MTHHPAGGRFCYDGYEVDPALGRVTCRYSAGAEQFREEVTFGPGHDWSQPAADPAARILFLLAGVSYYKTSAPPVVDLGDLATTAAERCFLRTFYTEGLAEFAYRNRLDLSTVRIVGPDRDVTAATGPAAGPATGRPLVPFGGGIDSIVTAESVRAHHPDTALFVASRAGDRFDAIELPAAVTGLPVVRAERELDAKVVRSSGHGYLNGHVPVTGIVSAMAVLAAVLDGRDAVVMSNEWSASAGNLDIGGRTVNHQWSKGWQFELAFRELLAASPGPQPGYFSLLRPYSELWVAERFAAFPRYHPVFRSCNRAFHVDRARRLDHWCGTCDKCCFIDLVLAPFMAPAALAAVFDDREPLDDPSLAGRFRSLLGLGPDGKPFECVGDQGECRAALRLAAARPDRAGAALLQGLVAELDAGPAATAPAPPAAGATAPASPPSGDPSPAELLRPIGEHRIPDGYLPDDATPQARLV